MRIPRTQFLLLILFLFVSISQGAVIDINPSWTVQQVNNYFSTFVHSPDPCDVINLPEDHVYSVSLGQSGFIIPDYVDNIIWNWNGSRIVGQSKLDHYEYGVKIGGCENVIINGLDVRDFMGFNIVGDEENPLGIPYENVTINYANCDVDTGLVHTNVHATEEVTGPSIFLNYSVIKAITVGVYYAKLGVCRRT